MLQVATSNVHGPVRLNLFKTEIDDRLKLLSDGYGDASQAVGRSMAYTLLGGGKRSRACLVGLSAQAWGGDMERSLDLACAVEIAHAASLILDDLPVMDDARFRRGRLTNHRVFGEHCAILAAFGLVSAAFQMIGASPSLHAAARAEAAEILGDALGPAGLVAGQMRDLSSISADTSPADVELTYVLKTAVLFAASLELGALAADAAIRERQAVYRFGLEIGVAFQIYDDLADRTASAAMLGKDAGRDGDKPTLVSLLGPNAAEDAADQRIAAAMSGIASDVGDSCELVVYVRDLQHKLKARLGSSH